MNLPASDHGDLNIDGEDGGSEDHGGVENKKGQQGEDTKVSLEETFQPFDPTSNLHSSGTWNHSQSKEGVLTFTLIHFLPFIFVLVFTYER